MILIFDWLTLNKCWSLIGWEKSNTNLWLVAGSPQDKKMFDGEAAAEGDTTTGDKQETTVDDVDERQRDLNKNNP